MPAKFHLKKISLSVHTIDYRRKEKNQIWQTHFWWSSVYLILWATVFSILQIRDVKVTQPPHGIGDAPPGQQAPYLQWVKRKITLEERFKVHSLTSLNRHRESRTWKNQSAFQFSSLKEGRMQGQEPTLKFTVWTNLEMMISEPKKQAIHMFLRSWRRYK